MADKTVTVKASAGDYTSLNAALSGESIDLVTNTRILTIDCYNFEDTTAANTGTGYTTSNSYYINIVAHDSHGGVYTTSAYRLVVNGGNSVSSIIIQEKDVVLSGLQLKNTDVTSPCISWDNINFSGGIQIVKNCVVAQGRYSIRSYDSASNLTLYFFNNLVYGTFAETAAFVTQATGNYYLYSNTFIGVSDGWGVRILAGTVTCKNCYTYGGTSYAGVTTMVTCASSDASTGTAGLRSIALNTTNFTNVTAGSENFHLPAGSALINVGTDTTGDSAPLNFTTDIDGETRTSWDIGADEYVAAVSNVMLLLLNNTLGGDASRITSME